LSSVSQLSAEKFASTCQIHQMFDEIQVNLPCTRKQQNSLKYHRMLILHHSDHQTKLDNKRIVSFFFWKCIVSCLTLVLHVLSDPCSYTLKVRTLNSKGSTIFLFNLNCQSSCYYSRFSLRIFNLLWPCHWTEYNHHDTLTSKLRNMWAYEHVNLDTHH
jgi:hypothetical protein